MAVAKQEIKVAVIVIVKELHAPSAHQLGGRPNPGRCGKVTKCLVLVVVIQRKHFLVYVGDEQVGPSILIVVSSVHTHTRTCTAVGAVAHPCQHTVLFEFPFSIEEEEIWLCVIGHKQIHPAVVIDVAGHYAPRLRHRFCDACLLADICERPIPIVMEQPARHRFIHPGNTVPALVGVAVAAPFVFPFAEVDKPANEQIEPSVVVIVEPHSARRPAGRCDPGLFRHVTERAVSVVVVKDAAAILRQVDVGKAISIIVTDGNSLPIPASDDPSFLRYICKCAIPIIMVKRVSQRRWRRVEVTSSAIHQVNVHPAIAVVIEKPAARARCLRQIHVWGAPVHVSPSNSAFRGR